MSADQRGCRELEDCLQRLLQAESPKWTTTSVVRTFKDAEERGELVHGAHVTPHGVVVLFVDGREYQISITRSR